MLSDKAIQEFRDIFKEEYNLEISDKEAVELGVNLLTILNHVYRPLKKEWLDELLNNNEKK